LIDVFFTFLLLVSFQIHSREREAHSRIRERRPFWWWGFEGVLMDEKTVMKEPKARHEGREREREREREGKEEREKGRSLDV